METTTNLNSKVHEKLNDWMSKLDQFQLQLSLGKMEAVEEYEKQKKTLHNYLHEYIQSAKTIADTTKEKAAEIKNVLAEYKSKLIKEEKVTEKVIANQKDSVGKLIKKISDL